MIRVLVWCGVAYNLLAIVAALRFRRRKSIPDYHPPVSILKPVRGRDPRFYEAIRSHAAQQYAVFELIFGALPDDPAREDIERLKAEFPGIQIRVLDTTNDAPNGKVGALEILAHAARHDVLLVNDGDIRVEPDYLMRVISMLQDLKVGHILGGTPSKMQIGDFMGVTVASFALLPVLLLLNQADINSGGIGFGGRQLPAPQAGLMAMLAKGIVGGEMAWPLIVVGVLMGIGLIMIEVRSPMLFAVGMYLPLETTFAIFLGGMIRWVTDKIRDSKNFNDAQKARVENAGVLTASGFIAGEALMGIVIAVFRYKQWPLPVIFQHPSVFSGFIVLVILAIVMIRVPLANAGRPDEPAPPTAIM